MEKKVLIEEDGHLSIDLTFVAQMFPNSASQLDGGFPFVYGVQAPDLLSVKNLFILHHFAMLLKVIRHML